MRRIISALFLSFSVTLPAAYAAKSTAPLQLAENAPERYIVVKGDTLWGISGRFLKDPVRWPELWRLNKSAIKDPHWIYPGQVVNVMRDSKTGQPYLELGMGSVKLSPEMRSEQLKDAIWSIPPEAIEPFLTRPLVADKATLDAAARVVAIQDNRSVAGAGDRIYATNIAEPKREWQIFRPGTPLTDPDTKEVLGHEALYLGTARQISEGDPAEYTVTSSKMEIGAGDRLLPAPRTEIINYLPHPPEKDIKGKVLGLAGGVEYAGKNMVVSLNRGKADGIELGHVLAIDELGPTVDDRFNGTKTTLKVPDRRNGYAFIFRVYDRVSYAMIMEAERPVRRGDVVRNP